MCFLNPIGFCITWVPHTGRRGRPIMRWADKLVHHFGKTWTYKAKDRIKSNGLAETYAQKWVTEGAAGEGGSSLT